ncbi:MAG: hypothetical protein JNJ73_05500 [Hyphomonadaceae bacterium]|nr:hypothetical protein [Hyphomonadaceae bacterium]
MLADAVVLLLRIILGLRYVLLAALVVAALVAINGYNAWKEVLFTVAAIALAVFLFETFALSAKAPYFNNRSLDKRVPRIAYLLRLCRKSLSIVSDKYDALVWDSDPVIKALEAVPDGVSIELYHRAPEIDPASVKFRAWCEKRGVTPMRLRALIKDRIIVDGANVRAEFSDSGQIFPGRPATFYFGNLEVAEAARQGLDKALEADAEERKEDAKRAASNELPAQEAKG